MYFYTQVFIIIIIIIINIIIAGNLHTKLSVHICVHWLTYSKDRWCSVL